MSDAAATATTETPPAGYVPAPGSGSTLGPLRGPLQLARFSRGSQIYFGPDHLLVLRETTGSVHANRFAYADVRGLSCTPNQRAAYANLWWFLLIIVSGILATLSGVPDFGPSALLCSGLVGAAALIGLLNNVRLGPCCEVLLFTATNAVALDGLARVFHAEAAIAQLRQRIDAVQGPLPADAAETPAQDWKAVDHAQPALASRYRFPGIAPSETAGAHLIFFLLLIVMAGLLTLDRRMFSEAKNTLDAALYAACLLAGCYAVARQRSSGVSTGLKRFTLGTLFFEALFLYVTSFAVLAPIIVGGASPETLENMSQSIDFTQPEHAVLLPLLYGMILWHGVPGIAGLLLTLGYRARYRRVAAARRAAESGRDGQAS